MSLRWGFEIRSHVTLASHSTTKSGGSRRFPIMPGDRLENPAKDLSFNQFGKIWYYQVPPGYGLEILVGRPSKPGVAGSSPAGRTNLFNTLQGFQQILYLPASVTDRCILLPDVGCFCVVLGDIAKRVRLIFRSSCLTPGSKQGRAADIDILFSVSSSTLSGYLGEMHTRSAADPANALPVISGPQRWKDSPQPLPARCGHPTR